MKLFSKKTLAVLGATGALAFASASHAQLSGFTDDFSGYGGAADMGANWSGFSDNCGFPGGYGFTPSTSGPQISAIASDGGNDFWNVYANYDNGPCLGGAQDGTGENLSLFVQQTFSGADAAAGGTWQFDFDYREAVGFGPTGTADVGAFIRVFDNFFNLLDEQALDTSGSQSGVFAAGSLSQALNALWTDGGIIQFGFAVNDVLSGDGSGMNYDNVCWSNDGGASCPPPIPVPAAAWLFGSALFGLVGVARRRRKA